MPAGMRLGGVSQVRRYRVPSRSLSWYCFEGGVAEGGVAWGGVAWALRGGRSGDGSKWREGCDSELTSSAADAAPVINVKHNTILANTFIKKILIWYQLKIKTLSNPHPLEKSKRLLLLLGLILCFIDKVAQNIF